MVDFLSPLRSKLKLKILLTLLPDGKTISELKSNVGTRETTILHVLKGFEELSLTTKSHGVYKLTSLGIIEAQICSKIHASAEVVSNFREFWLSHDVSPIPATLLLRLGALKDSSLIKNEPSDLEKVHDTFMQVLLSSKKIRGISPIFHHDYVSAVKHLLGQGNFVELVLTNSVLQKTIDSAEAELLKKYMTGGNLVIFLKEDLKVALTVTEKSFSLGLFDLGGEYDYSTDLVSLNPEAIKWGEDLFRGVVAESKSFLP
jgi:predicted transcriptional regulator